jgi:hypothetical protein
VSSLFFHFFSLFFFLLLSSLFKLFPWSQAASVATLPSALFFLSDCRSVQVGYTRFSRCCYLIIDLCSPLRRKLGQDLAAARDFNAELLQRTLRDFRSAFAALTAPEKFEALQCVIKSVTVHPQKLDLEIFELQEFLPGSQNRKLTPRRAFKSEKFCIFSRKQ